MQAIAGRTVAERIRELGSQLTRAERQLANAMLEDYPVSSLGSITALAASSGVSTPTVARMARKLGFAGFPELQQALRRECTALLSNPIAKHERWAEHAPDTHVLNRFAEVVSSNLQLTLRQLDVAAFDQCVALMGDPARKVLVTGGRITGALASYFTTHLRMLRPAVVLVEASPQRWPEDLVDATEGDVLMVFDIRRYDNAVRRLASAAAERGLVIVLFTDQWGSPVSRLARATLKMRIEAPSAWDSSVAILFVVESIIAAVQDETWPDARHRMAALEALFDKTGTFRQFI